MQIFEKSVTDEGNLATLVWRTDRYCHPQGVLISCDSEYTSASVQCQHLVALFIIKWSSTDASGSGRASTNDNLASIRSKTGFNASASELKGSQAQRSSARPR